MITAHITPNQSELMAALIKNYLNDFGAAISKEGKEELENLSAYLKLLAHPFNC